MANSNMRIEWVDAAKGIGILMVMFGHNWLLFLFISYAIVLYPCGIYVF